MSLRRKVLGWSHFEGGLWAAMVGCSETLAIYHAVQSGLTTNQIALITTLPLLLGACCNWLLPRLVPAHLLKVALLGAVGIQVLGLCGLVMSVEKQGDFIWVLGSLIFYMVGGTLASPLWIDWMSPWLPDERISRYLSRRNSFTALVTVISYLSAAAFIHKANAEWAYKIIFGFAFLCRLISWLILFLQPHPHGIEISSRKSPSKISALFYSQPMMLMLMATVVFRFVQNLASPFFLPYMTGELHFTMLDYAWITAVPFLARSLFLAQWGEAVRTYRPFIALQTAMIFLGFVCIAWTFFSHIAALTIIESFSGIAWGGFELAIVLIMHNFKPGQARSLIGFHFSLQHFASLGGSLLGATLLKSSWTYHEVFSTSGILRLCVGLIFILMALRIKETQVKLRVYGEFFITAMSLRPQLAALSRFIPEPVRKLKLTKS